MLFSLAGSSCSGKSTAARACAGLDRLAVHDFDEIGVPPGADTAWRQQALETWLGRVLDYQRQGVDTLLTSQSPLGEVLAAPAADRLDGLAACLLDVDDDVRLERLRRRDPGVYSALAEQAFVGWARWHRGHAADPRHLPEVLTAGGWPGMAWERWADWVRGDPRWKVTVIDTTGRAPDETAASLRAWIAAERTSCRAPLFSGP
jgi:hypothetical protein